MTWTFKKLPTYRARTTSGAANHRFKPYFNNKYISDCGLIREADELHEPLKEKGSDCGHCHFYGHQPRLSDWPSEGAEDE